MLQLLKIEWLKVKNYRTFWILSILFAVSIFGVSSIAHEILSKTSGSKEMDAAATMLIGAPPFRFPDVWHTITWLSSFLSFIPALLIIILTTNEFSFKTHRQNIIDGLSRTQFVMAKIADAVVLALASAIVVAITILLFGFYEGNASFSLEGVEFLLYYFIQVLSYCSAALLLSVLFKRSGITIGIFFLYITILERIVAGLFNKFITSDSGDFLPLHAPNALIPLPVFKVITNKLVHYSDTSFLLIASFVYLALYVFIVKRRLETSDL